MIEVNVYDNTGKLVIKHEPKEYQEGENNIQITWPDLPKGLYNCALRLFDGQYYCKKIVKH